jgi:hypothetical protein
MSEIDNEKLLARIAALETEVAPLRAAGKQQPGLDPKVVARAIAHDPLGALKQLGVDRNYVTQILVAAALEEQGQPVPDQLRAARSQGSTMAAQSELRDEMSALRQRMDAEAAERARESAKAVMADKTKYPRLAAAYATAPDLFAEDVNGHKGDAAVLADKLEKRLAATAKALGVPDPQPASQNNADSVTGEVIDPISRQGTARASGAPAGDPPPISSRKTKGWSEEDKQALRDQIVRNAERGVYDSPTHPYKPQ